MQSALGLIETKGLIGAIEAADAGTKAANVKLIAKEYATGALVLIKFEGEVAAVKAAVDAASAAAQRVGQLVSAHIIPRPDDQIDHIIYETGIQVDDSPRKKPAKKNDIKEKQIEKSVSLFDIQEEDINIKSDSSESSDSELKQDKSDNTLNELPEENTDKEEEKTEDFREEELDIEDDAISEETESKFINESSEKNIEEISENKNVSPGELKSIPPMSELEILNVHQLRKLARTYENFPIKGRDISKANRGTLLDHFRTM